MKGQGAQRQYFEIHTSSVRNFNSSTLVAGITVSILTYSHRVIMVLDNLVIDLPHDDMCCFTPEDHDYNPIRLKNLIYPSQFLL